MIADTLRSAIDAGWAPSELLVIDDGSTDATADIARSEGVEVLSIANGGKALAVLAGVAATSSAYVVLCDADTLFGEGHRAAVLDAIDRLPDAGVICGRPRSRPGGVIAATRAIEYAVSGAVYKRAQDLWETILVAPGCASVYRRDLIAGLDDRGTVTEDLDWTVRAHRAGFAIAYAPEIVVHTQDPSTVGDWYRQVSRWHRGFWQTVRLNRLGLRRSRLDAYVVLTVLETVALALALPWMMWTYPRLVAVGMMVDLALMAVVTFGFAAKGRRDVVKGLLAWAPLRLLALYVFVVQGVRVWYNDSSGSRWNSPARY